eukprot:c28051_g1_i2 orf=509-1435(-)
MEAAAAWEEVAAGITRVGWIGTGLMGMPMCSHLQNAGFQITVFNRTISKAQILCDRGATYVDSPFAVAQCSDVVFTMLGNASEVRQVILSKNGVLAGLCAGGIIVDCSSSEPSLAREIFSLAEAKGIQSVDAPVSGGEVGAQQGSLAILAGGKEETVKRLEPLLKFMGKVTYMGPAGAGQSCKLANQISVAANFLGLAEGLTYANKAGLDLTTYLGAVSGGAAGSKVMDSFGPRILRSDLSPGGFAEYMVKDLGLALKEAQAMGASFPGLALSQQMYLSLVAHGDGRLGAQSVLSLYHLKDLSVPADP